MEVFKPNMFVTLCFSDVNVDSSPSAVEKSVNISNRLFQSCFERHQESEVIEYFYFHSHFLGNRIKFVICLKIYESCLNN